MAGAILLGVTQGKRRKDEWLARYFAYRIRVWEAQDPKRQRTDLAERMGVAPPVVTQLAQGENGSHGRVAMVAAVLGPESEDEFKRLAKEWADLNSGWNPKDPLPEKITHTGDPLEASGEGTQLHSEQFREAARHLVGLAHCSPDEARAAATLAWEQNQGLDDNDWYWWLGQMRDKLKQIRQGSGKRPSSRVKLAT